jgi:hypothetical protein
MKRTTVFADESDLAILKDAARRQGIAEAELIRDAIHLAAMANRTWARPFFTRTYVAQSESPSPDEALEDAWSERAEAYERSKSTAP